jgi:hypothetical protein
MPGKTPFMLEPKIPVLYYLQRLRDEAHRFAIGAHRTRRSMDIKKNPLDEIDGIGPGRKKALLHAFGSAARGRLLGLFALRPLPEVAVPAAVILFREFAVSALRESAAARGHALKVTWLAKWKTTLQLVGLGLLLLVEAWAPLGLEIDPNVIGPVRQAAVVLIWVAAAVTLWTGWDYVRAARRAIPHEN